MSEIMNNTLKDPLVIDLLTQPALRPKILRDPKLLKKFVEDFLWPINGSFKLGANALNLTAAGTLKQERETELNVRRLRSKTELLTYLVGV